MLRSRDGRGLTTNVLTKFAALEQEGPAVGRSLGVVEVAIVRNVFMQAADGSWSASSTLDPSNVPAIPAPNSFGVEVGVFRDFAIVGAPTTMVGVKQGAVYVFNRIAGSWTYTLTLTASDGATGEQRRRNCPCPRRSMSPR
jgi:hypothetical protein